MSQHRDCDVACRAKYVSLYMLGLFVQLVMGKLQESVLICIASVLLVAQHSPKHCDEVLPMLLHGSENPPLALIHRSINREVPDQFVANGFAEHTKSISIVSMLNQYQDATTTDMLT